MSLRPLPYAACLILALFASPQLARAQDRFAADMRVGYAFPDDLTGGTELNSSLGLGAGAHFRFMQHISVYAAFDWFKFDAASATAEVQTHAAFGPAAGLELNADISKRIAGWISGGGAYKTFRSRLETGSTVSDSRFGWEAGAGMTIPLSTRLSLAPALRYRSFRVKYGGVVIVPDASAGDFVDETETRRMTYTSVELGLVFH